MPPTAHAVSRAGGPAGFPPWRKSFSPRRLSPAPWPQPRGPRRMFYLPRRMGFSPRRGPCAPWRGLFWPWRKSPAPRRERRRGHAGRVSGWPGGRGEGLQVSAPPARRYPPDRARRGGHGVMRLWPAMFRAPDAMRRAKKAPRFRGAETKRACDEARPKPWSRLPKTGGAMRPGKPPDPHGSRLTEQVRAI